MNKRTAKRKQDEWERVYGSSERVQWVRRQKCVVTGISNGWSENVHVRTGGTGRKADACWIVPMVGWKHMELHRIGVKSFEEKYGIDLQALAVATEAAWQLELKGGEF